MTKSMILFPDGESLDDVEFERTPCIGETFEIDSTGGTQWGVVSVRWRIREKASYPMIFVTEIKTAFREWVPRSWPPVVKPWPPRDGE